MAATPPRPAATADTTRVPVDPVASMAAPADIVPARRVDSMVAVEADSTVEEGAVDSTAVAVVDPTAEVVDTANQLLLIRQRRPPGRR